MRIPTHLFLFCFAFVEGSGLSSVARRPGKIFQFVDYSGAKGGRFNAEINNLPLSDSEVEAADQPVTVSRHVLYYDVMQSRKQKEPERSIHNYHEVLFATAVDHGRLDRLRELLNKRKDRILSPAMKTRIFQRLLLVFGRDSRNIENIHPNYYEMLRILLQNGFYNSADYEETCPFFDILRNEQAYNIFIEHDPKIFSNQSACSYMEELIIGMKDFAAALRVTKFGFNENYMEQGRNFLDIAIGDASKLDSIDHKSLQKLIQVFKFDYGMKESTTFENFLWYIENNQYENALRILRTGKVPLKPEIHPQRFESPLEVAIPSLNPEIIEAALEIYLSNLSRSQLQSALRCANQVYKYRELDDKSAPIRAVLKAIKLLEKKVYNPDN